MSVDYRTVSKVLYKNIWIKQNIYIGCNFHAVFFPAVKGASCKICKKSVILSVWVWLSKQTLERGYRRRACAEKFLLPGSLVKGCYEDIMGTFKEKNTE